MSGKVALDTSIVVPYLKRDPNLLLLIRDVDEVLIPFIVVGELFFGAFNSTRIAQNVIRVKDFCRDNIILSYSNEIAEEYGKIKAELKTKGRPIPENDIWIGAVARFHRIKLVTRDDHFTNISNLSIVKW